MRRRFSLYVQHVVQSAAGIAALTALVACAQPAVTECGATGVFCPSGTHCAAAQGICISDTNECGNAHLDPGEVCDDGNTNDGDGCSHDCQSNETCGNGIADHNAHDPEDCDDGAKNGQLGDPCSATCHTVRCGNGFLEQGEECDDGNVAPGDGCSANCTIERCGNGIVDPGEACDLVPQDLTRCSADCKSTLMCGNGTVDPGEECDVLGMDLNSNDCRADCISNRCGDGFVDTALRDGPNGTKVPAEQCDDAPQAPEHSMSVIPTETQHCNVDCTTPSCGDGKINHAFTPPGAPGPEQCDNVMLDGSGNVVLDGSNKPISLNSDTAACTATCQINVCGDGKVLAGVEDCDDGDQIDTNGCTNDCKKAKCGDGIVEAGVEQCDDHNNVDGDGCSHDCKIEFCGDGIKNDTTGTSHEDCDTAGQSATCNADCTTARCGDGIVNPLFKPDGVHPEQCDPPSVDNGCSASCQFEHCGNGIVDPGEQCDDGNTTPGDGCFNCHLEKCGNGILDQGEQCDDGNKSDTDACISSGDAPASCKIAVCGDGHVEAGIEQCDDGNTTPGDGCFNCHFELCGNGILDAGEQCDDGNQSDTDGCISSNSAPSSCKLATCGDGHVETGVEQCDDGPKNGTPGDPCNIECRLDVCGDGVTGPTEQCDAGSIVNGKAVPAASSTCDADCTFAVCGDHTLNTLFTPAGATHTEQCDLGNANSNTGACTLTCQLPVCGDGFTQSSNGEDCDSPGSSQDCPYATTATACTVCSATCKHVAGNEHFCGDGQVDSPNEVCDDGNTMCGACNSTCTATSQQNATGVIFAAAAGDYRANGDTFTIGDGFTSVTFELTTGTAGAGNVKVSLTAGMTNAQVATAIVSALGNTALLINANTTGSIVNLTHAHATSLGNVTITETVATTNFAVVGMSGGEGGNCMANAACKINDDCASHNCSKGQCGPAGP